jgi:hypothetical protein
MGFRSRSFGGGKGLWIRPRRHRIGPPPPHDTQTSKPHPTVGWDDFRGRPVYPSSTTVSSSSSSVVTDTTRRDSSDPVRLPVTTSRRRRSRSAYGNRSTCGGGGGHEDTSPPPKRVRRDSQSTSTLGTSPVETTNTQRAPHTTAAVGARPLADVAKVRGRLIATTKTTTATKTATGGLPNTPGPRATVQQTSSTTLLEHAAQHFRTLDASRLLLRNAAWQTPPRGVIQRTRRRLDGNDPVLQREYQHYVQTCADCWTPLSLPLFLQHRHDFMRPRSALFHAFLDEY